LVFVGDYVDRGPDSKGVIDALLHLSEYQKCIFLMGNHEDMMLWYLGIDHGNDTSPFQAQQFASVWIPNGGGTTLASYGIDDLPAFFRRFDAGYGQEAQERMREIIGETHIRFLETLAYSYIEDRVLFVHAGVSWGGADSGSPEQAVAASRDEHLLWDREAYQLPNNFGTMIYGHTPSKAGVRWLRRPEGAPYSVGVDVGCVFKANPLTAVRTSDWSEIR